MDKITLTLKQMSKTLDMSERQILYLAAKGIVIRIKPGKYDLIPTLRNYLADYREKHPSLTQILNEYA
jgi:hypothetical protein